jgi:hypothetical protein
MKDSTPETEGAARAVKRNFKGELPTDANHPVRVNAHPILTVLPPHLT